MGFIIEDTHLKQIIKKASNLLTKIEKEDLPNSRIATGLDLKHKDTITKMKKNFANIRYYICDNV